MLPTAVQAVPPVSEDYFGAFDGMAPNGPIDPAFDHEAFDTSMDGAGVMAALFAVANPENAGPMSAYMRNQFPFLGVKSTERRAALKPFLAQARKDPHADWSFVASCWAYPQREFQYAGIDYLLAMKKKLTVADLPRIKTLMTGKSWWDTIDALDPVVYAIVKVDRAEAAAAGGAGSAGNADGDVGRTARAGRSAAVATMRDWARDENFWVRRAAIIHQLSAKADTDAELLAEIIEANLGSDEFFINKAIGWALRNYARVNPDWVLDFVASHDLAPLSKREALKHLAG